MDAIDHAKKGDLEFFKEAPLELLLNARDSDGNTVLSIVVDGNHVDCCEVICKRFPSLLCSQHYQGGYTPLHAAAYSGYLDILKILISTCDKAGLENQLDIEDQGGDIANRQKTLTLRTTSDGYNAMHKAVHGHQLESIKLLLQADPNKELLRAGDHKYNTPLHLAVELKSDPEIAKCLIKVDPDFPYGANSVRKTPLLIAIHKAESRNDKEMLKLILELQPTQSMVMVNEDGWTALHYCVSKRYLHAIGCIIRSYPESSKVPDNEGQNFFHLAVKLGRNEEMVKYILGKKEITSTVLNSPDKLGRTPWDVAAVSRNENIILCLHEDPRVNKKLTLTNNLNWVVEKHNFVMMNLFLKTNADFLTNIDLEVIQNSVDEEGDTIFFKAAQENHLYLCQELYKRCPSLIYHQSKGGRTALHHAAWKGENQMLKFLIAEDIIESRGGEKLLTMVDDQGDTALHRAVLNHKLEAVNLLVEADCDYDYGANTLGDTPIMISVREARSKENKFDSAEKIRKLLFKRPSQTMARTGENNWTLLHQATFDGDLSIIKDIIEFCPRCLDVEDHEGRNFLHIAANLEKIEVVNLVLRAKDIPPVVLNNEDNDGNTPFHIAALTRNEPLTRCFLFDPRIEKNTVNKDRQHVLHAINFSYNKKKAGVLDILDTVDQCNVEVRDSIYSSLSNLEIDKPQSYSRKQLKEFTKDFSHRLGSGGFGDVYKGQFPDDGVFIAVKVLKNTEFIEEKVMKEQFKAEVNTMGRAYHCNLIKLNGYCYDPNTKYKALVYDYMENGSFDKILFEKKLDIPWAKLHNIAKEIAQGISYLHESCKPQIIHQDIKPANVLLDSNLSPKIIDFGLAKVSTGESQFEQTNIKGSRGYMAPEINQLQKVQLSNKVDVYSFGMILFDILGSKRNHVDKIRWFPGQVWEMYKAGLLEKFILDCGIKEEDKKNAERLAIIALLCVEHNPRTRPKLSNVVKMLEGEIIQLETPDIPFSCDYIYSSESCSMRDTRDD